MGFHECTNSGYYPHIERFGQNNRLMRHICSHVTGQMVTMVGHHRRRRARTLSETEGGVPGVQLRLDAGVAKPHGHPLEPVGCRGRSPC